MVIQITLAFLFYLQGITAGFKSYPVRTQITGWDSSFNAITGLNGSGKSNILDAICFVLGITNMSAVRRPIRMKDHRSTNYRCELKTKST